MHADKPDGKVDEKVGWGSDVAAQMLRRFGFPYVSLNPGASYRGLHDSLVNHLGNADPSMLLCLHEDHAVGIAHGYAKATGEPMACVLHSNVGLMHGMMALYNAWCDRAPMFVLGATGPVDASQRRPWIDWIHTSADQGGLIRDFIKWDNQPTSADALVEAMARANIITRSEPKAPVYICLDAGLQEAELEKEPVWPDLARLKAPAPPRAAKADLEAAVALLKNAKRPVILCGKTAWSQESWDARVALAERLGAVVMTDLKNRASFPTDHPAHAVSPFNQVGRAPGRVGEILEQADVVLALEWVDLASALRIKKDGPLDAKVIATSLDQYLHNGAHANYQALPSVDIHMAAAADTVVADLLAELGPGEKRTPWQKAIRKEARIDPSRVTMDQLATSLRAAFENPDKVSLAGLCRGWPADLWPFRFPQAYLGKDGGGGIGSGPALSVGAALANHTRGIDTVAVLGDGDFAMGGHAIWTAVRHRIPLLVLLNNNRSYFNDELHQESVARRRGRPLENRWIGQVMTDPDLDFAKFVEAQGAVGIGPVKTPAELEAAIKRGVEVLRSGGVCLIDVHVEPGEERGAASTGLRKT
jgi:thiamine pyrophosphate-dependent acetolactate synthase large subunit-like protein